jgi:Na+/proline symporter
MKAVLWADTVQMTIVFAGMLTILIEGCKVLGGLDKAWDIANKNGRIVIFE